MLWCVDSLFGHQGTQPPRNPWQVQPPPTSPPTGEFTAICRQEQNTSRVSALLINQETGSRGTEKPT